MNHESFHFPRKKKDAMGSYGSIFVAIQAGKEVLSRNSKGKIEVNL